MESVTIVKTNSPSPAIHTHHTATKNADASISEIAHARLHGMGHIAFRQLTCEHVAGTLRLRGQVPSYYLKQLAQELVRQVDGVDRIVNAVEVV